MFLLNSEAQFSSTRLGSTRPSLSPSPFLPSLLSFSIARFWSSSLNAYGSRGLERRAVPSSSARSGSRCPVGGCVGHSGLVQSRTRSACSHNHVSRSPSSDRDQYTLRLWSSARAWSHPFRANGNGDDGDGCNSGEEKSNRTGTCFLQYWRRETLNSASRA